MTEVGEKGKEASFFRSPLCRLLSRLHKLGNREKFSSSTSIFESLKISECFMGWIHFVRPSAGLATCSSSGHSRNSKFTVHFKLLSRTKYEHYVSVTNVS